MRARASKKDLISLLVIIVITSIITGVHGLVSILFMITVSRLDFGRDSSSKHGVSSGASRLGGISILFSLTSGLIINHYLSDNLSLVAISYYIDDLLIFSFLIGLVGLVEDFYQNLSSKLRLSMIMIIVGMGMFFLKEILPFELEIFNPFEGFLKIILVYMFTVIMVSGFVNAGNIADGANGLLSMVYTVFFLFLYSIDPSIIYSSAIVSLIIFFIYNITTGSIFLGDFGAYFLSAFVAFSSLKIYSDYDISVFLIGTILIYPCFEITRTLIIRFTKKVSLMSPDNNHLHNYLHDYLISVGLNSHNSNSLTGLILASLTSILPLYLFIGGIKPNDNIWLPLFICEFLFLCLIYLILNKINLKKI